jgi:hypothetical protein
VNRILRRFGVVLVPIHSAKMLHEYANVLECHHPSRVGAARWLRVVAGRMP